MNNSEYRLRCDMDVCAENELRYCNTATADIRWSLAEIDRLRAELKEAEQVISAVEFAAHLPDDYEFGLPSWVCQVLYAAYIGAEPTETTKKLVRERDAARAELARARAAVWREAAEIAERKPKPHMDAATAREIAAELRGHAEQAALRAGYDAPVDAPEGLGGASNAE